VLIEDAPLSLREYVMGEELPLATIFRAIAEILRERDDAVIFGAHAVNAYAGTERMTEDVDVLTVDAAALAERIRSELTSRFHVAFRVREVARGQGQRVYQLRSPKNRHVCDVRAVEALPPHEIHGGLKVLAPVELVAMKVISYAARRAQPKGATDLADLRRLLLAFPLLRSAEPDVIAARVAQLTDAASALDAWRELRTARIEPDEEED
jgi:hypothetical protein